MLKENPIMPDMKRIPCLRLTSEHKKIGRIGVNPICTGHSNTREKSCLPMKAKQTLTIQMVICITGTIYGGNPKMFSTSSRGKDCDGVCYMGGLT